MIADDEPRSRAVGLELAARPGAVLLAARLRFYWVVVVGGALIMALEILASRLLAPHFGSSVYVWGSIISVFLASMAFGYRFGGWWADQHPSLAALGRVILMAALCQSVLLIYGEPLAAWLGRITVGTPAGTLIATALLFGPVSLLLAAISPFAVRLAAHEITRLGDTAGHLFALSTAGSLVGTLGCTFGLIPYLQLRPALALLTVLTALTAAIALVGRDRRDLPYAVAAMFLVVVAGGLGWSTPQLPSGVLQTQITPYQTLEVRERRGIRLLISDRTIHGAIRIDTGQPAIPYLHYPDLALLYRPRMSSMLVLGMGSGLVGRRLQARLPELQLDYVDIDPAVPKLAERYFGFSAGRRGRVHVADARQYLATSDRRWDVIFSDVYIGLSVPFHLTTREFLDEVRRHLEPDGVFVVNIASTMTSPFPRAMHRTIAEAFRQVHVYRVFGGANNVLIATNRSSVLHYDDLLEAASRLDEVYGFDPSLSSMATQLSRASVDLSGTRALTDEFAPVERLMPLSVSATDLDRWLSYGKR